ncbi:tripartite tricarboxylate transporter substrate binding protein [Variovorax sp.]|uniref:tripartite tricarboxylate transporter substrate binding protein n=1 Tax=Variovorax sp. TaxID=1871043 RepID=UPI002D33F003|nr:tripartite tricarboxylate transporter substrate binding protein [Variovorax sp.]HYP83016.1 tripartite tricarboxylate transporter substrate binding protein [Variovorax sp.]
MRFPPLLARPFALALAACLLASAGAMVHAQAYPTKPVVLVVPYPPGGTADILARSIGQKLGERIGQPVVIENKAGAGTAIGARFVAEAAPDGYTLLLGTVSSHAINPAMAKVGYDPVKDFAPIAPIASIPFVLVANPDAPYKSVGDVLQAARAQPGTISYASAGPGTSNHLAGEMLATDAKVRLLHVPYRGSAPALADVLAGHVPLMFDLQSTSVPNIRLGKLRALAVTSARRSPLLPDVPTVAESGLPGFEVSAWFALFAPARVPPAVAARLSQEMTTIMGTPEMAERLKGMGAEPDHRTTAELVGYVREEAGRYGRVVKAAGLSP